tara:strand:+ start:279 stop:1079 length:801 start_codon:yes stop_codon:yes gene_type:complete
MSSPFVFLLDLDGTMQGDVRPQLQEYELIRMVNRNILHGKKVHYGVKNLYKDMVHGLLRPGLKQSLLDIKQTHPHVEFFVYTASSTEWANYIIPMIEKHCFRGQFFNRPLLTRAQVSESGVKSIARVFPIVAKTLASKYKNIYKHNVYLIDNNTVLNRSEMNHLILCPSYDYTHVIDPLRNIPEHVVEKLINIISERISGVASTSKQIAIRNLYAELDRNMKNSSKINKEHRKDIYFESMRRIVCGSPLKTEADLYGVVQALRALK